MMHHLCCKLLTPIRKLPCGRSFVPLRLVLQMVCAMIHCGLKFVIHRLEHLDLWYLFGIVLRTKAPVGSVAGATFTGAGLSVRIVRPWGFLLPLVFAVFVIAIPIAAWAEAQIFAILLAMRLAVFNIFVWRWIQQRKRRSRWILMWGGCGETYTRYSRSWLPWTRSTKGKSWAHKVRSLRCALPTWWLVQWMSYFRGYY